MSIKMINGYPFIPYHQQGFNATDTFQRARAFCEEVDKRRSCRHFSDKPVAREVIEQLVLAASTAPSGAHKQPWTFCIVSNPAIKQQIRAAAEKEEQESYRQRMNEEWLRDLAPIGTDWEKPFLTTAPYLVIVFSRSFEWEANGHKHQNYYVKESVGIACGLLLAAIQQAGLSALTHTPSPMNFLSAILNRPGNERPFLLIPVGYAADDCWVPRLQRKKLEDIAVFY